MKKNIKEAISIIEDVRKSMPECANKAFLKGVLNELQEALKKESFDKMDICRAFNAGKQNMMDTYYKGEDTFMSSEDYYNKLVTELKEQK